MLGGQDENKGTLSSGEKYDPDTNSWSSLPPMNEASSLLNCWNLFYFYFGKMFCCFAKFYSESPVVCILCIQNHAKDCFPLISCGFFWFDNDCRVWKTWWRARCKAEPQEFHTEAVCLMLCVDWPSKNMHKFPLLVCKGTLTWIKGLDCAEETGDRPTYRSWLAQSYLSFELIFPSSRLHSIKKEQFIICMCYS